MPGTWLSGWCEERGALDEEAWILEDRDFCFEGDFPREGLDILARLLRQLGGEPAQGVDEALAKYLILMGGPPVCLCRSVGEEELRFAFESGAASMSALRERTGATTGCGGCAASLATLLRVWKGEPRGGA
jgi:bacterioferritin-associated ferredoxin